MLVRILFLQLHFTFISIDAIAGVNPFGYEAIFSLNRPCPLLSFRRHLENKEDHAVNQEEAQFDNLPPNVLSSKVWKSIANLLPFQLQCNLPTIEEGVASSTLRLLFVPSTIKLIPV